MICGNCGKMYYRRTRYRDGKLIKVWQCATRYAQKGVPGCGNRNLHERDLYHAFALAWTKVVAERNKHMPEWQRKMREGNELEALRAQQMMEFTAGWSKTKTPDNKLARIIHGSYRRSTKNSLTTMTHVFATSFKAKTDTHGY